MTEELKQTAGHVAPIAEDMSDIKKVVVTPRG